MHYCWRIRACPLYACYPPPSLELRLHGLLHTACLCIVMKASKKALIVMRWICPHIGQRLSSWSNRVHAACLSMRVLCIHACGRMHMSLRGMHILCCQLRMKHDLGMELTLP
jgi:hypothetical protein